MKDLSKIEKMSPEEVMQYIREARKEIEQNYYAANKKSINKSSIKRFNAGRQRILEVANADAEGRCSKSIALVIGRKAIAAAMARCVNFTFSISALIRL